MIRSKFTCCSVEKCKGYKHPFLFTAKFRAVYSDDPNSENRRFWDATPSGEVVLSSIHEDAFAVGQDYYLDFTAVGAPG